MSESIYPQNQPLPQPQLQMQAQLQVPPQGNKTMNYGPVSGVADQVFSADGKFKPEWDYLLTSLSDLGPAALAARQEKAQRILRDDGATYNIYGDAAGSSSHWELDIIPSVIGSADWAQIESVYSSAQNYLI
ncbi:hypothetical protein QWY82_07875 [Simiduia curdlanivorans]|uniref:hypothetical protein n=1 Tax=Simiduia curdlanivorans TaxID=1492769 RepID=UPI0025B2FF1B|nr:hypothetical protein [Simiduia curdlanivorans]MDN3638722.1 hypothetical protein [Simiduia curdlanivorans]